MKSPFGENESRRSVFTFTGAAAVPMPPPLPCSVFSVTSVAVIRDAGLMARMLPPLEVSVTLRTIELLNTVALLVVAGALAVIAPALISPVAVRLMVAPGQFVVEVQLVAVAVIDVAFSAVVELIVMLVLFKDRAEVAVTPPELLTVALTLPAVAFSATVPVVSMVPPVTLVPVIDTAPPPALSVPALLTDETVLFRVNAPPLVAPPDVLMELPVDDNDTGPPVVVIKPPILIEFSEEAVKLPPVTALNCWKLVDVAVTAPVPASSDNCDA